MDKATKSVETDQKANSSSNMETILVTKTPPPGLGDKFGRLIWELTWLLFGRLSPTPMHFWRRCILRAFGAKIGKGAVVYSSTKVWRPSNLTMEDGSCLGRGANCYNVSPVTLKRDCVVSQRAYLCSASHDIREPCFPLVSAPITIGEGAWVAAEAFIGPGVVMGHGSVAAARSVVTKSVSAGVIVGGNPATPIGNRDMRPPK